MIDLKKQYKTRNGLKVVLHEIKLKNSCGKNVTYPVKGTIYHSPRKKEYMIWSIDGIIDVVFENNSHLDLVEV